MGAAGAKGASCWTLRLPADLRLLRCGTEGVLFNPISWNTHLLNEASLEVVEALLRSPSTVHDLVAALFGEELRLQNEQEQMKIIESLLLDLEALGLAVQHRST